MPAYRVTWDHAEQRWVITGPDNRQWPLRFTVERHAKDMARALNDAHEKELAECGS